MRLLRHLIELAEELWDRGVGLVVIRQQIDTITPHGRLFFHTFGVLDEFQRELIVERTYEGLAAPRARTGGPKPKLTDREVEHARDLYAADDDTVAGMPCCSASPGRRSTGRSNRRRCVEPGKNRKPQSRSSS
jgi:DNA invertase Pin-like site-specific DNA recombinase